MIFAMEVNQSILTLAGQYSILWSE